LIESELFGCVRGLTAERIVIALVHNRPLPNRGTLFLDEIGEMPIELQSRLLRVPQSGDFTDVGSAVPNRWTCALIAAPQTVISENDG